MRTCLKQRKKITEMELFFVYHVTACAGYLSLQVDLSLSHTGERRRAKRSGRKESGEEATRRTLVPQVMLVLLREAARRRGISLGF